MTCSRDKDLYILRAGRGVNKFNADLVAQSTVTGKNLEDLKNHGNAHLPYNHWNQWRGYKPIRGYIHFGITDKLTSECHEILKNRKEWVKGLDDESMFLRM